jgi:hypothetical protein
MVDPLSRSSDAIRLGAASLRVGIGMQRVLTDIG